MTQQLKILNSKEIKHVHTLLQEQFGYTGVLDVVFLLSEKKQRLYIFTRDLAGIDVSKLRVDAMGLYFGTFYEEKLRLTIDGTQLIGKECGKNIIEVSKSGMQRWMMGERLQLSGLKHAPKDVGGFGILMHGDDYLGCGKISGGFILNYLPKTRYIHALYDDLPLVPFEG